MKLYVDLSVHNCRYDSVKMETFFYIIELKQWLELGTIFEDADGFYVIIL